MQRGLGKGLEALIPLGDRGAVPEGIREEIVKIAVSKIKPNKYQARKVFDEEKLKELADSIQDKGVIQPLVVSPSLVSGEYELIAGERRLRASQMAKLTEVPAIIRNVTEKERHQISLIENLQREDLNPIEEAKAFTSLMEEFKLTQDEVSRLVGKDRSVVANTVRLLSLSDEIQELISRNMISAGHARTLAGVDDREKQNEIARRIINEKLTVRDIEKITQDWKSVTKKLPRRSKKSPEAVDLENELQRLLGAKVELISRGKKGKIIIHFYSLDELDRLLAMLKSKKHK